MPGRPTWRLGPLAWGSPRTHLRPGLYLTVGNPWPRLIPLRYRGA